MKNTVINPFAVILLGTFVALVAPFYPEHESRTSLMDIDKILITGGLGGAVFSRATQSNTQIDVEQIEVESSKN